MRLLPRDQDWTPLFGPNSGEWKLVYDQLRHSAAAKLALVRAHYQVQVVKVPKCEVLVTCVPRRSVPLRPCASAQAARNWWHPNGAAIGER